MPGWSLMVFSLLLFPFLAPGEDEPAPFIVVKEGKGSDLFFSGTPWKAGRGFLEGHGVNNELYAPFALGPGDFTIRARITLPRFERSAAAFFLDQDHFGFDGRGERLFVQGPWFGRTRFIGKARDRITPGRPFLFEAARRGRELLFRVDGKEVHRLPFHDGFAGRFGFRPWRGTLRVHDLEVTGKRVRPPAPKRVLSEDTSSYTSFHGPVLLALPDGTLLAFCAAGRKGNDGGEDDLLLLRSADGGESWSEPYRFPCGAGWNPTPPAVVYDPETAQLFLFTAARPRPVKPRGRPGPRIFLFSSTDEGRTWSAHRDVTASAGPPGWSAVRPAPATGIRLEHGEFAGRLVLPFFHRSGNDPEWSASHVVFSDDHGKSWHAGGATEPGSTAGAVFERGEGIVVLNLARAQGMEGAEPYRRVAASQDGGGTWSRSVWDRVLMDPAVQAGILRADRFPGAAGLVLFTNPCHVEKPEGLTVRFSFDQGWTWHLSAFLHRGVAGGSSVAVLPGGRICCLFETGKTAPGTALSFLAWKVPRLGLPPD